MNDHDFSERERQAAEIRRRIAEGGPDQHVPGNTKAGRVEAEELRVSTEELRVIADHVRDDTMRTVYRRVLTMTVLVSAVIALIPGLIGLYLVREEGKQRTNDNAALIQALEDSEIAQSDLRAQNRELVRDADVSLCQDLEDTKAQLRAVVVFNEEEFNFTLEQLNIDPESVRGQMLKQRSQRSSEDTLDKLKARKGGCESLPHLSAEKPPGDTTNGTGK